MPAYPHDEVVIEVKELVAEANRAAAMRWDDDMDQYYVEKTGDSPMQRTVDRYGQAMSKAGAAAERLLALGSDAVDAVAKGLRQQGRFRELLIPYAEAHREHAVMRDTLQLLARRKVDPLASVARRILGEDG